MTTMLLVILASLGLLEQGWAYNSGYWTPDPTSVYYNPTTASYLSYWTPSSTYTTYYTQADEVVTVTSILPCPVTSTVVYWICCDQCANDCATPPPQTETETEPDNPDIGTTTVTENPNIGTTTVTSYTTTTPEPAETVTTNGLVVVIIHPSAAATAGPTPTLVYQVQNDAPEGRTSASMWTIGMVLAAVAAVMVLL